jgi:peptide/nickel transport system substrate-binding protein
MKNRLFWVISLVIVASMLLAACGTTEVVKTVIVTEVVKEEVEVIVTEEVIKEVEVIVTPEPIQRTGAWVDEVVFTSIDAADSAVAQLQADKLDVYAYSVSDAALLETVKADPALAYSNSVGSYNEVTFNPAVFVDAEGNPDPTKLNPFSNPKIREAFNWLIDRNYIVQEIFNGLAIPKFFPINASFPDYAKYVDVARELEAFYAYNPDKAKEQITTELTAMGATVGADGKFLFNDAPLSVIFIIRTEDERRPISDYISNQMESIGFTVDRQYKTRTEASPIWVRSNPADGLWNMYSGGWITTAVSRDDGSNFSFFYGPRDYPIPLHMAYTPSPEFDEVSLKLRNNDFTSIGERDELFATALRLAAQDSVRVWLIDELSYSPRRSEVAVSFDLAGGIAGSYLWPYAQKGGAEGGTLRIAQPGLLVDPWNPVAGSNWIYDSMPIRGTADLGFMPDPYTGLAWPWRTEKATVVAKEGLPIGKTLDWVDLSFEPEITVPADAWYDWDTVNQKWITVGEAFTTTQTALTKATVYYPADLWTSVTWHDGSPITMGDFVMAMILPFDRAKPESALYDEAQASNLEAYLAHFKGVVVESTDPLVITTYDDLWYLDAELIPTSWWPAYGYGPGAWHNIAVGTLAEADGKLAFSADKADANAVEWMNFVSGPSIEILYTELVTATGQSYIPFAPTMGAYVTADEAALRYENLGKWVREQGHFWLGTGPFYLNKVFTIENTLTLSRNENYPDAADRWSGFGTPKLSTVEVDGAGQVKIGDEAKFDVYITFGEEPYPNAELGVVKYLLFDAKGALVATGEAEAVSDGQFLVTLPADVTSKLEAGSNKLEIAVVSKLVSIPSFAAFEFVTAP